MSGSVQPLEPGSLWARLEDVTARALTSGALRPLPTESHVVPEGVFRFLARVLRALERKDEAREADASANPFLPYDPDLLVADLSPTHVGLLNKYNVVEHHLLLCTRAFEHQEQVLTRADLQAAWIGLAGIPGLVFYNAGTAAGASQPHKHLQLVPLPLSPAGPDLPIRPALDALPPGDGLLRSPLLPFEHRIARLPAGLARDPDEAAQETRRRYLEMLRALDRAPSGESDGACTGPYNLLLTRDWLLVVPRTAEHVESVSLNALAFAGSFFVRNTRQLERLRRLGFLAALGRAARSLTSAPATR